MRFPPYARGATLRGDVEFYRKASSLGRLEYPPITTLCLSRMLEDNLCAEGLIALIALSNRRAGIVTLLGLGLRVHGSLRRRCRCSELVPENWTLR